MDRRSCAPTSQLLIKTCHRRGVHAMGGMAAQIPIKDDPAANEAALAKVRADKLREVKDGHDGTWVAHPGLVADREGDLRRAHAGAEPARRQARGRAGHRATTCSRSPDGHAHRGRPPPQRPRRRPVPRGLAARERLRAALQPDGGRGDGRDLARPGLAVAPPRRRARRQAPARPPERFRARRRRGDAARPRARWATRASTSGRFAEAARPLRAPLDRRPASKSS